MSHHHNDNKIKRTKVNNRSSSNVINRNNQPRYQDTNVKNKNRKKSNKRKKRSGFIKKSLIFLISIVIMTSLFLFGFVSKSLNGLGKIDKSILENNYISENIVDIDEIPAYVKDAVVAIEDERFYKHNGVDIISLGRSLLNNIFTDTTQGGSTIDMQVSKNLLTTSDQTMTRKIKDIFNAIQMNKTMSKDDILEAYLNNIYLARSSYGVLEGSKAYFGKDVRDLTLGESAMLVGITNNPGKYKDIKNAKVRQEVILNKMRELGYITEDEYIDAVNEVISFV